MEDSVCISVNSIVSRVGEERPDRKGRREGTSGHDKCTSGFDSVETGCLHHIHNVCIKQNGINLCSTDTDSVRPTNSMRILYTKFLKLLYRLSFSVTLFIFLS